MQSKKLAGNKISASTQKYLDIAAVHDDVVVMKDATLRMVLMVSSINFALKSEDEQNALISAYAGFLNALDYPIQIVVQSRPLNIDDYLSRLNEAEGKQNNELLKTQINDYRGFIAELVKMGQLMSKKFFVVVSFNPLSNKRKGFFARLQELFTPAFTVRMQREKFLDRKKELMLRIDQVVGQLQSMGINSVLLDTQSLIELYYNWYNPDAAAIQKLTDVNNLQVEE